MPDRRGRKGSVDDFFPDDILPWARETWRDREEVAYRAAALAEWRGLCAG